MFTHELSSNRRTYATDPKRARRLRQIKFPTQEELADASRVSVRTISNIESGHGATISILRAVAVQLDLHGDRWMDLLSEVSRREFRLEGTAAPSSPPATESPGAIRLHRYSGRWNVLVDFNRWRGRQIAAGESVAARGYLDLWIHPDGSEGWGVAHGTVTVELLPSADRADPYSSRINVVDRVEQVRCTAAGGLTFQSETFCRFVEQGDLDPHVPGLNHRLSGPVVYAWSLDPTTDPKRMTGRYAIPGDERDTARVEIWRLG
jgi:transcriptional regulator with XRE-family HTH domain